MPSSAPLEVSERRFCDGHEAGNIHSYRLSIKAHVVLRIYMSGARANDYEIDSAEQFSHRFESVRATVDGDICIANRYPVPQFRSNSEKSFCAPRQKSEIPAFVVQLPRQRFANAGGCTDNDC